MPTKMGDSHIPIEEEQQVKVLKRRLEGWRELVLLLNSILVWKKKWHPALIAGTTTTIFICLYILDPSLLTIIAIAGLSITMFDYLVPTISAAVFPADSWSALKEKQLDMVCRELVAVKNKVTSAYSSFQKLRDAKPVAFYGIAIAVCLLLAWIGNTINNLLLTYVGVTSLLLWPGARANGMVSKYSNNMMSYAQHSFNQKMYTRSDRTE